MLSQTSPEVYGSRRKDVKKRALAECQRFLEEIYNERTQQESEPIAEGNKHYFGTALTRGSDTWIVFIITAFSVT